MGGFGTKCRFGFSKALLSTTQPPHQKICGENIAKNSQLPTSALFRGAGNPACEYLKSKHASKVQAGLSASRGLN